MFGPIRAVVIDDEPNHLLAITLGLSASGIPCMGYWYDRDTQALRPEPQPDQTSYLRLVFMDLNLAELGGVPDPANLCGVVMGVLKQIIAKEAGPYLLVFWTQISGKVEAVADMLYQRLDGIPLPVKITELSKSKFISSDPKQKEFRDGLREFYSDLHNNSVEELGRAVREVVACDAQLAAVSSWESRASKAAARAINEVTACARGDVSDSTKTTESLQKVLAKIAVAASGKKTAVAHPARALDGGMIDILTDQFGLSVDDPIYGDIICKAIGEVVKTDISFANNVNMFADLNTFFHVDKEISTAKAWDRGAVIAAKHPLDGNMLGFNTKELITREFLFPHELFPEDQHIKMRDLLSKFKRSANAVLVEVGADCDHAQDSYRTRRYLVGLEVPHEFYELIHCHKDKKLRNASLELLGPWRIDSEVFYLLVSCRRFWTWQKRTPPEVSVKYRLRASLVNKLLHHYSVWSSRPGIVEFRS